MNTPIFSVHFLHFIKACIYFQSLVGTTSANLSIRDLKMHTCSDFLIKPISTEKVSRLPLGHYNIQLGIF